MNFEFSPYILSLLIASLIAGAALFYIWPHRETKPVLMLILLAAGVAIWSAGYALEIAGADLATKLFWGKFQYFGIVTIPVVWLFFAITYTSQTFQLTRRMVGILSIVPLITLLLTLTTEMHGLVWKEYEIYREGSFSALQLTHGMWFWVYWVYSQLLLLAGTVIVVRSLIRVRGVFRGQRVLFFIAVLAPWIGNALYVTGNSPIPYLDLTPFAFTVSVTALVWAIFGFRLLDITPLARDRVIDSMREGMIVLDVRGNIVDINNSAARMIGVPVANAIGKIAGDIFSPWPHLMERFRNVMEARDEISVGEGEAKRRYEVRLSPLQDQQEKNVGRVIMLRALGDATPLPRFAVKEPISRPREDKTFDDSQVIQAESKNRLWNGIVNFFSPPIKTDLPVDVHVNPIWVRTIERVFTILMRIMASIGMVALAISLPYVSGLLVYSLSIAAVVVILWVLALWRTLPLRFRTTTFMLTIYGLALIEIFNFGYSVEAFTYFVSAVVFGVVLEELRGGLRALLISLVILVVFGLLITLGIHQPVGVGGHILPSSLSGAIASVTIYLAVALSLVMSINTLMSSLNASWQKEVQALNLLQQERDLLEQRVEQRTGELSIARDEAVKITNELRKYYRAIEQSGSTIVIADINGKIEYANPMFEQSTGYTIEEAMGQNPRILKSGKQTPESYNQMWKTISSGNIWTGEFLNKRKDGSLYWESATIAPVADQNGVISNYVAIKEDITARRQAEEQLRKLSQAVEQSGNTVIMMDKNGLIEYVNPKFIEVTGYSSEEALGTSPIALMNSLERVPDFSQDEWWLTVTAGKIWHGEFRNHRKDGSVFWESATIAPVRNNDGEVTNFVEIKEDITEQRTMQDQLQKQNDYLSILHQITLDLLNRRELNDLLQVIVDRSAVLLDAPFSELMLEEGGVLMVESFTDNQQNLKGDRVTREQAKLSWQAFDTHQPVILEDYSTWEYRRDMYNAHSLHATADFPVMAGDRCLGILALGRSQPDYGFTAEQVETGILFARLVALVLDNASLYDSALHEIAERERAQSSLQYLHQQQEAINSLLKISLEGKSMDEVLGKVLDEILSIEWLTVAPKGGFFLFNEQTNMLDLRVHRNLAPALQSMCLQIALGQCLCGRAALSRQIQFADCLDDRHEIRYAGIQEHGHYNIPILQGDRVLGVMVLYLPHGYQKSEEDLTFLRAAADAITVILRRKQAEMLLLESEARFRQIVENASDIIYRTDNRGNFTYVNPTSLVMVGFEREEEVLGRNYLDLVVPEFKKKVKRFYDHQFFKKEKSTYYEFPALNTAGEIIWFGQNVRLIEEGDEIIGFQTVARDITQLVQAREALALSYDQAVDASQFKSQLLSRVSHELRTPLGGILGYAELLEFKAYGPLNEKQHNAVNNIIESTHYLTSIVNDLLDESQIESKSISLHSEYFIPAELLKKTKTAMSTLAAKKNLHLRFEVDPDLPSELYGDITRLQQILINLAGNAIKFTKAGEVNISLKRPAPGQWSIEVRDTGAGIPLHDHQNIFEPFRQVSNLITRENRGSGLGLAITKQLAELMGGQIRLESEIGKGSLFTVLLPITNAPGE